ncbi:Rpn family recombination-promoting nuclease/putative transposase [Altericista sp. CCNU0014]|uniref:Rpn family recombination-promoting nuclease/putative transposase n=1 Tax=Altericista sp. CCNU0014 TaxID=3082949 RepID=UPI00385065C4
MTESRSDLDSPWKDILRAYFPPAIAFFFPQTAALIDWSKPYEFLDKEFQAVSQDAAVGRRYADQLVKVWLKGGTELWLLLHLEVQSQSETEFEERMFIYSLRIFDQFRQVPISLAILCDESLSWRPSCYEANYPDTSLNFKFGTVKLLDWRDRMDELESSDNPFATVVMAHLKVIETKRDVDRRKNWKFRLTRGLYEKGYERQEILDLYRFIDWILVLPEAVEREFWQELQVFEEERKVTYVTNAERFGIEKGLKQGIEQGAVQEARSLILRLLSRRVGILPSEVRSQVESLSIDRLESLGEALLDFSDLSDLERWLQLHA